MSRSAARRPPGIRFEAQPPSALDELPRMDVAAFVGFAASGPLHHPVLVEDVVQFQALFGEDLPLALDPERGEVVHAHLGPTVRAFFRNGGRRCWVVRVAGRHASYNHFPLPGLLRRDPEDRFAHAHARARSEGSWSDTLRLAAGLSAETLWLRPWSSGEGPYALKLAGAVKPEPGDLLRVRFASKRYTLLLPVETVELEKGEDEETRSGLVIARGTRPLWLDSVVSLKEGPHEVRRMANDAGRSLRRYKYLATVRGGDAPLLTFDSEMTLAGAPPPGTPLRIVEDTRELWFTVRELHMEMTSEGQRVQASGELVELSSTAPTGMARAQAESCERLTFGLWVRRGGESPLRLEGLGFCPRHPRYWGALPSDLAWFQHADEQGPVLFNVSLDQRELYELHEALRQSALSPRFPLAGPRDEEDAYFYPIGMEPLPETYLDRVPRTQDPLVRDGLRRFDPGLFLDEALMDVRPFAMLAQAHFLQYQSPRPRLLRGIHALLTREEVTLVAVPDAVHRPWLRDEKKQQKREEPAPKAPQDVATEPSPDGFHDCNPHVLPVPTRPVAEPTEPALGEAFKVSWSLSQAPEPGQRILYTLKEAIGPLPDSDSTTLPVPDPELAPTIYRGAAQRMTLFMQGAGTYHYFVRAEQDGYTSPWSEPLVLQVSPARQFKLAPVETTSLQQARLRTLHEALLNMCAARGDLLAVLSLPAHFHADDVLDYAQRLRGVSPEHPEWTGDEGPQILCHGALYHPWPVVSEPATPRALRTLPPDGAACGVLARRANERGVWVTPANEPWRDVVALTPTPDRQQWLELWERTPVNVVLQEPRGFVSLTASTLATTPELEPIHVRRLLALLRRAAIKLGTPYIFEPNSPALQRGLQRGFEQFLGGLLQRGAFAGGRREDSFQVVLPSGPDTGSAEGRLLVELRVAPSSPLTFLNVRLVQSEDQGLFTQEG